MDLSSASELKWPGFKLEYERTCSAGNCAPVQASTADSADPNLEPSLAHASSKGAFGPVVVDQDPNTS